MVSGQYTRCEAHNDLPDHCHQRAPSLFAQLAASGRTWRDWEESMTNACDPIDSGAAWARNIYSGPPQPGAVLHSACRAAGSPRRSTRLRRVASNDVPMGTTGPGRHLGLRRRLQTGAVGDLNLVGPNDCENGHDPCGTRDRIRQFDGFLAREVPKIEASPAFGANGTILITWDEGADPPQDPGHVAARRARPARAGRATSTARRTTTTGSSAPSRKASASRSRTPPPHASSAIWR